MRVGRDAVPACVALYVDARPRTAGGPPGKPAGVKASVWSGRRERESGAMPRGALRVRRRIRARMRRASCASVARSGPGRHGEIRGMRAQRATPRIGGKAKEQKTGRPQRPKMKAGANFVRLLGCLTSEDVRRCRRW